MIGWENTYNCFFYIKRFLTQVILTLWLNWVEKNKHVLQYIHTKLMFKPESLWNELSHLWAASDFLLFACELQSPLAVSDGVWQLPCMMLTVGIRPLCGDNWLKWLKHEKQEFEHTLIRTDTQSNTLLSLILVTPSLPLPVLLTYILQHPGYITSKGCWSLQAAQGQHPPLSLKHTNTHTHTHTYKYTSTASPYALCNTSFY